MSKKPATTKEETKDDKKKESWAKLNSLNFAKHESVALIEDSYTVGRLKDNSINIEDPRLSGKHCTIYIDRESGKFYLEDTSSNGTFVNDKKVGKGNKIEIKNGDTIHLLHNSKVSAAEIMGYVFCATVNLEELANKRKREEEALEAAKKEAEAQAVQKKMLEDMSEEMQCVICIDFIYQCVSAIPCLHNFCAACLSDWVQKSDECPNCREKMTEVKKNATLNNMIQKFLENNPDKKRDPEEMKQMDSKNKVTKDRMKLAELKPQPVQPQRMGYAGGGLINNSIPMPMAPMGGLFMNLGGAYYAGGNDQKQMGRQTTAYERSSNNENLMNAE